MVCASKVGEREVCPAGTSSGVALVKSADVSACLLGKTWGYDDKSVWVSEGCSGEFSLGQPAPPKHFGTYIPNVGFKVVDTEHGTVIFKVFTYLRYLDQKELDPTFTDSFGNTSSVKQRQTFR